MRSRQTIIAIALVLLLGATVYALLRTGQPRPAPTTNNTRKHTATSQSQTPSVDQSPLKTAQQLAQLALTPDERPLAQEALRLADYEVDLAFAAALKQAHDHPPELSAEAKEIQGQLQKSQKLLQSDKALVDQLTAAVAKATDDKKDALQDDLDLAKAQVELDQDEVDDAKQDLIRAGGDPEGRIQAMVQEHEAATHNTPNALTAAAPPDQAGLIHRFQQWSGLHQRQLQLWRAKAEADAAAASLSARHNALDTNVEQQKTSSPELAHHAKTVKEPRTAAAPSGRSREESAALVKKTKQIASDQQVLAMFDKRIETEKELSGIYSQWIGAVAAEQRATVHRVLIGVLIILVIALVGIYFDGVFERLIGKISLDRRQVETLRTVTRVALQVVGILFILLVILGPPGQLGTFLGLAGAGLTVALKDFIVGFIGWFVLMGKNGVRLGDWVEINGVTGEVVEIGPIHTVLLETGNWTDLGHPTGRRVTFTNSFAIEGHYFNFSTTGQWLWDELQVVLPADRDPYPMVEKIRNKVQEATKESAQQAEEEWRRATRSRDMSSISVAPAMSVKPVVGGIEVAVRYITRANERYRLRAKLYQEAVDLLGQKAVASAPTQPAADPA